MSKQAVAQIIDALTPAAIAKRLNVTLHAVRYAKTDGMFPASWYAELRLMCVAEGQDCPMSLFNWKRSDDAATANPPASASVPHTPTEDAA